MRKPIVRIVRVEPMRLAFANATGKSPEVKAHRALFAWAAPKGLLADRSVFFFFGRNNPPPSPGKEAYGYDSGITVDPALEIEGDIKTEDLRGGWYALVRTNLTQIREMWEYLYQWVEGSAYSIAGHGLEELLTPEIENNPDAILFDLWLPIKE
jgi:AraC family transcriptional regulator